jgi:hypothetical protein
MDFLERVRGPRLRRAAGVSGALLALWSLVGFLLLPAVLRPVVERKVGEALHRKATLRGLSINPFALSFTLRGLDVKDRDGTSPFLSFESLYLNVEVSSVFRRGTVLRAITLVKPAVTLVRNADNTYSVQDLVEEFSKPKPKDDKPLRFSLNNIRLEGGRIDFDDRPKTTKHEIRDLLIGIPFLSNIPSKVQITTQSPELWVLRETMGQHKIVNALAAPGKTKTKIPSKGEEGWSAPAPPAAAGKPFLVQLAEAAISGGVVHYDDFAFHPSFHAVLSDVAASVKGFSTVPGSPAAFEASARSDAGETFRNAGTLSMDPAAVAVAGTYSVEGAPLKRYTTFVDEFLPVALDAGVLGLKTRYTFSTGKDANTTLSDLAVTITSPRVRKKSEKEPFFTAASLAMTGSSLDVGKHAFVLGDFTGTNGFLAFVREKNGSADLMELTPKPKPDAPPPPSSAPWDVTLGKVDLRGWTVKIDDRGWDHAARYALTKADVLLENLSTAKGSKGTLAVRFGVDGKGVASAKGAVGFQPIFADLKVDVKGVDLVPLEAYVLPNLRLALAKGVVNGGGTLAMREDPAGKASVVYTGNALVANFLAVDESSQLDFLKWETFSAAGMKAGYNPLFLEVKQLAAVGVSCDVTIEADGTMNLRRVVGSPAPKDDEEGAATAPGEAKPAPAPTPAPVKAAPSAPGGKDPRLAMPIRIDEITLQGGRIGLSDHFIKPNYSAKVRDLAAEGQGRHHRPRPPDRGLARRTEVPDREDRLAGPREHHLEGGDGSLRAPGQALRR